MSVTRQKPRHKPHHPRQHFATAVTTARQRRRGRDVEIKSRPRRIETTARTTAKPLEQTNFELRAVRAQTRAGRSSGQGAILHAAVSRTAAQRLGASSPSLWRSGGEANRAGQSHYAHAIRGQRRPARRIIRRIRPQLELRPPNFVAAPTGSEPRGRHGGGLQPVTGRFTRVLQSRSSGCGLMTCFQSLNGHVLLCCSSLRRRTSHTSSEERPMAGAA